MVKRALTICWSRTAARLLRSVLTEVSTWSPRSTLCSAAVTQQTVGPVMSWRKIICTAVLLLLLLAYVGTYASQVSKLTEWLQGLSRRQPICQGQKVGVAYFRVLFCLKAVAFR